MGESIEAGWSLALQNEGVALHSSIDQPGQQEAIKIKSLAKTNIELYITKAKQCQSSAFQYIRLVHVARMLRNLDSPIQSNHLSPSRSNENLALSPTICEPCDAAVRGSKRGGYDYQDWHSLAGR